MSMLDFFSMRERKWEDCGDTFGATVNKGVQYEQTPLHEAARLGHQKICRKLLEAGARIDGSDVNGIKPFFTAAQNGQTDILTFLIENGECYTDWHILYVHHLITILMIYRQYFETK